MLDPYAILAVYLTQNVMNLFRQALGGQGAGLEAVKQEYTESRDGSSGRPVPASVPEGISANVIQYTKNDGSRQAKCRL